MQTAFQLLATWRIALDQAGNRSALDGNLLLVDDPTFFCSARKLHASGSHVRRTLHKETNTSQKQRKELSDGNRCNSKQTFNDYLVDPASTGRCIRAARTVWPILAEHCLDRARILDRRNRSRTDRNAVGGVIQGASQSYSGDRVSSLFFVTRSVAHAGTLRIAGLTVTISDVAVSAADDHQLRPLSRLRPQRCTGKAHNLIESQAEQLIGNQAAADEITTILEESHRQRGGWWKSWKWPRTGRRCGARRAKIHSRRAADDFVNGTTFAATSRD